MGPSWPHRSRSGVAMTASGFFDLKELVPGLPFDELSVCAAAPISRACMWDPRPLIELVLSRSVFRSGPASSGRLLGTTGAVLSSRVAVERQCVTSGTPDWCEKGRIATWITNAPGDIPGQEVRA